MQERLQKILSACGVASRRKAEELISQGRVTVNGQVCKLGDTADKENDLIYVDGRLVGIDNDLKYIMLNKPRGYVTTMKDEKGRKTVRELVDCGVRVYPVGRLDMDSEGLLLLTNDGELTNQLIHPRHEVDKTYLVWVKNATKRGILAMQKPMTIDGYTIKPATVEVLGQNNSLVQLQVVIHEGRNRQIRKMAEKCGMEVTKLRRIAEGPVSLGDLKVGQWRYLTKNEVRALRSL